jgi:hypothetical protein
MSATKPGLVAFGAGGHTVYFHRFGHTTSRQSGYDNPGTFFALRHWWADPPDVLTCLHDPAAYQGVPVIDMRAAVTSPAGMHMAISGPMVDVDLTDDEVDACASPSPIFAAAVAGNAFGTLLQLQKATRATAKHGALDSVSVPEYVRLWREAGARIGNIVGAAIEWETP